MKFLILILLIVKGTHVKNHDIEQVAMKRLSPMMKEKRGRVIGGANVFNKIDFPSYVSIRKYGGHICGGTILDNNRILTATHCRISTEHKVKPI